MSKPYYIVVPHPICSLPERLRSLPSFDTYGLAVAHAKTKAAQADNTQLIFRLHAVVEPADRPIQKPLPPSITRYK